VWDSLIRNWDPERLARALSETSIRINKAPTVVIVESHTKYGNAKAFAIEFAKAHDSAEYLFICADTASTVWATENGINHVYFDSRKANSQAKEWEFILKSAVSVHESHDFWRRNDDLFLRAMLAGSHRIQLWHGSTGPIGKEIGLGRLSAQPAFWHFTALASTSVGWDELVCEPNFDEARRLDRVQAKKAIHDIEFRLVDLLKAQNYSSPSERRLVVVPTFPETASGEIALTRWIAELGLVATKSEIAVDVYLHPSSKKSLRKSLGNVTGIKLQNSGFSSSKFPEYSAVITDFSSIAHDALLVGMPVIMATFDLQEYAKSREILVDQQQWDCAYIVSELNNFESVLEDLFTKDSKAESRNRYRHNLLEKIEGVPGMPTIHAVETAMAAHGH
jgi:hypothetical protein